jgi:hypothetical protein
VAVPADSADPAQVAGLDVAVPEGRAVRWALLDR